MLKEIAALLGNITASGTFATRRASRSDDLHLEVKGIGLIRFPISRGTARELCAIARPARYGFKDQTILDESVRDTWEIAKSKIKIDQPRWKKTIDPMLERIRSDLGLSSGARLRAELYNLLVYEEGQFFVEHQDSEKEDGMIGTLIVTLPSAFEGGEFVVHHHSDEVAFRDAGKELSFIAFYADCHHEVRPVEHGFRIVLTYNLILEGDASKAKQPALEVDALARAVAGHFENPLPARWRDKSDAARDAWSAAASSGCVNDRDAKREPPDRLVYLLDHEYTQKGLSWTHLKNGDAARVAALRDVAERLGCEIFLALADVHETWGCEDEYYGRSYRRRGSRQAASPDTPALIELHDSEIELRHWIGLADAKPEEISNFVDTDEVCFTKASVELEPFKSEHEGYMGNWGNTVDRWYHRAAVVLWPRERTFVIRSRASASWAAAEIEQTLRAGSLADARKLAERALPFWKEVARKEDKAEFFYRILRLADALDDDALATALLEPFALTRLTPKSAPLVDALLARYGLAWWRALLSKWSPGDHDHYSFGLNAGREKWISTLPALLGPLSVDGCADGIELARFIAKEQWRWISAEHRSHREHSSPSETIRALNQLNPCILALLECGLIVDDTDITDEILQFLTSEMVHLLPSLVDLLKQALALYPADGLVSLRLGGLHAHCAQGLRRALDTPARAEDDWSIPLPSGCSCELCGTLAKFLAAKDEIRLDWPLNKDRRSHVHRRLDAHELPVSHETERSGSPYTLVLVKTRKLFELEAKGRRTCRDLLAWLEANEASFSTKPKRATKHNPRKRKRTPRQEA
jgi:hypothetical protein